MQHPDTVVSRVDRVEQALDALADTVKTRHLVVTDAEGETLATLGAAGEYGCRLALYDRGQVFVSVSVLAPGRCELSLGDADALGEGKMIALALGEDEPARLVIVDDQDTLQVDATGVT